MANINVTLTSAALQTLDLNTNLFRVNDSLPALTLASTDAFYNTYQQCATGAGTVITLPSATVWFVVVKNLSATANLTVQLTVAGGVQITAANSPILLPGGIFMYVNSSESTGGITGVTLIGSVANTPALVLLAA